MATPSPPIANVITLGAHSVPTLRDFYRRLGWPLIIDDENFAAFELRGAVLALFAADKLAADGRAMVEPRQGGIRFTIGIMVDSRNEVDQLAERVRQSGGRLAKEPVDAEFFAGRSAYFADPEDNYWEIAWAPGDNAIVAAAHRAARVDLSM
jgi:predicted lactoylglutathione lyase